MMMTQNENCVVWAEEDENVDLHQLFSVSSTSRAKETFEDATSTTHNKENITNASTAVEHQQPLSLFHPTRKRALAALKHSSHGRDRKEISPYSSNMERSLQQRRIQRRTQRRCTAMSSSIDDKDDEVEPTLTSITTESLSKQPVCSLDISKDEEEEEEDPFGDFDDCDFDAIDDLVLSRESTVTSSAPTKSQQQKQLEHEQQQIVDLFDELPDEDFFFADPSDCPPPHPPLFQPIDLPKHFVNPKSTTHATTFSFSRYYVLHVKDIPTQYTKYLFVRPHPLQHETTTTTTFVNVDTPSHYCSQVLLKEEWYFNPVHSGDTIHIVSPSGEWCTKTLPLSFQNSSQDDLLLVVEPDIFVAPTLISEGLGCFRRAVLKQRMGSGLFSNKFAVFGTLRHALFQMCLLSQDFSPPSIKRYIKTIVRNHAETILGAGLTDEEAIQETSQSILQLQRFASLHFNTTSANNNRNNDFSFRICGVHSIEESAVSPELGLKGNIDALVRVDSTKNPTQQLMGMELKTGHNQKSTNQSHVVQLSLYSLMLQARYDGNKNEGILLYLNNQDQRAVHVTPSTNEFKSLISIRNQIVYETKRSFLPRDGDPKTKEEDGPHVLPTLLPDITPSLHDCNYCYSNSICMLYARTEMERGQNKRNNLCSKSVEKTPKHLLNHFTGHLTNSREFDYFRHWDRLIDLEAQEYKNDIVKAWLRPSMELEKESLNCISSLVWDSNNNKTQEETIVIKFDRHAAITATPLTSLNIDSGDIVVLSSDGSIYCNSNTDRSFKFKHRVQIVRGTVHSVSERSIHIFGSQQDWAQLQRAAARWQEARQDGPLLFRLDKDEISTGAALLRQNLANLFLSDVSPFSMDQNKNQITNLFEREKMSRLRDCIVNFSSEPRFDNTQQSNLFSPPPGKHVPCIRGCDFTDLCMEYFDLNTDQQKAVAKIVAAQDYALMHGLPGTGKSYTIAFIARLLAARGCRVLITSYTHSAVDNLLIKIMEAGMGVDDCGNATGDVIRIGKEKQCLPVVHGILATSVALENEQSLAAGGKGDSPLDMSSPSCNFLRSVVSKAKIVGVSALTAPKSSLLVGQHFDVVVVDEAGQICQPAILGPLMVANRFVLVGDHMQLPPLTKSKVAESAGYGVSMMKRLADAMPVALSRLSLQYRMHKDICDLCNEIAYKGTLHCANEQVSTTLLKLNNFPQGLLKQVNGSSGSEQGWLHRLINPRHVVVFADTDNIRLESSSVDERHCTNQKSTSGDNPILFSDLEKSFSKDADRSIRGSGGVTNATEVNLIRCVIKALVECGLDVSDIGVISPLRSQTRLLEEDLTLSEFKGKGLEISTIDKYQGRDKAVILISLVRSNGMGKCSKLLDDYRRLNVAVSRAKRKLIFFGSSLTLHQGSETFRPIIDSMKEKGWLFSLPHNACVMYKSS